MSPGKKRALWLLCIIIVILCALMLHGFRISRTDPLYNGTRLSTHIQILYGPRPQPTKPGTWTAADLAKVEAHNQKQLDSRKALYGVDTLPVIIPLYMPKKVGTEAAPLIQDWLASTPPTGWCLALGRRLAPWLNLPSLTANRRELALRFVSEFPIPIDDPRLSLFASALTNKTPEMYAASLALLRCLDRGMKIEKDHALRTLFPLSSSHIGFTSPSDDGSAGASRAYHVEAQQLVDDIIHQIDSGRELIPLYTLEMGHIPARVGAALELAEKPRHAERAIPLLITNLSSSNRSVQEKCALALAAYGSQARSALPALTNLLDHPRERVRLAASNAIVAINKR